MTKRVVVALGGNAILQPKQAGTAENQFRAVQQTCAQLADMIKEGYQVVITHGNGPQVGNILLQNDEAKNIVPPFPLDVCGAQTQGFIGYMIQQSMGNLLPEQPVVSLVTQVQVSADDPGFQNPTKPIGPFYNQDDAEKMQAEKGWAVVEDSGRGWRRVVPSPNPTAIVEKDAIAALIEKGFLVIASGGGGIPVVRTAEGKLQGVEAVIDKDLAGQRLAADVKADVLLILTDVEAVAINFGKPEQQNLGEVTVGQVREYQREGHFKAGSMGPKVEAACRFVEAGGQRALIASLNNASLALAGKSGTQFTR
jgi:carbamate kinase